MFGHHRPPDAFGAGNANSRKPPMSDFGDVGFQFRPDYEVVPVARFGVLDKLPSRAWEGNALLAMHILIADVLATLFVQIVLAVRVGALKRKGRALMVPSVLSTLFNFNNLPYWRFLLSREHIDIRDAAVSICVWAIRLGVVVLLATFVVDLAHA